MSNIQEIHSLQQRIYDIVQDYIDGCYSKNDALVIGIKCNNITLKVDDVEIIKTNNTTELYQLWELVRTDEENNPEPDIDKISDIANSWLFLD